MMNTPPICRFPTQALIIDDSKAHLESLEFKLSRDHMTYKFFSQPQKALDYLNHDYKRDAFIDRMMKQVDEMEYEHHIIELNISDLYKELYNSKRFQQVSCVIVDYDMPGINGLELCKRIKDPYIQKILLTGAADQETAVQAFNEGIIQHFLTKTQADATRLQQVVDEAQVNYFQQLSAPAYHCILGNSYFSTALREHAYKELMQRLIKEHHIVEYYLFERCGSTIMVDEEGALYGLFIAVEEEITAMAENAAEQLASDNALVQALRGKSHIVCYHQNSEKPDSRYQFPAMEERHTYLRPAKRLEGYLDTFFYAFTNDCIRLSQGEIVSFESYKDNLDNQ